MTSSSQPSLPPLYFFGKKNTNQLPAEVLHKCLVEFADWGDLARLANVQLQWSNVMYDAANVSPRAKWELAQALLDGTSGLAANPEKAMKLLQEVSDAAVQEDKTPVISENSSASSNDYAAPAMRRIASCYLTGSGVEANAQVGLKWMEAAHETGNDLDAAHEMALVFEHGQYGVDVDVVAAVTWFRKAAEAGHMEAMAELGLCYELGLAVEQSDEEALDWYMKAAEKGHLTARFSVGEAFEEARGVPQSDEEACLWYYKAAIEGDEDSRKALRRLEDIARIVLPGVGRILSE